jgi:hypothetical protein
MTLGMQALKRIGKPGDVAAVVAFLASDARIKDQETRNQPTPFQDLVVSHSAFRDFLSPFQPRQLLDAPEPNRILHDRNPGPMLNFQQTLKLWPDFKS